MKTVRAEDLGEKVLKLVDANKIVLITRDGRPAAHLTPTPNRDEERMRQFIEATDRIGAELDAQGVTEEDILADFAAWRRNRRR